MGVFAQKAFASGEVLERCPCLWVAFLGYEIRAQRTKEFKELVRAVLPNDAQVLDHVFLFKVRPGMNVTYLRGGYWINPQSQVLLGGVRRQQVDWNGPASFLVQNSVPSFSIHEWN